MKRAAIALVVLTLLSSGCASASREAAGAIYAADGPPAKATASPAEAGRASEALEAPLWAFGLDLLARQAAKTEGNVVVSPASLHAGLCMALNGADGETAAEMRRAMAVDGLAPQAVNQGWADLIAAANGIEEGEVRIADSLWIEPGIDVEPAFVAADRDYFAADVRPLPETPDEINAWVEKRTGGRIKDLLTEVTPDTLAILVNTVYVKAGWIGAPFDAADTRPEPFTLADGERVDVPMMHAEGGGAIVDRAEFIGVALPANGPVHVWIIVPKGARTPESVIGTLQTDGFASLWDLAGGLTSYDLALPRFRTEYTTDGLISDLEGMGMERAFSPDGADFSRLTSAPVFWIDKVLQKTFLEVNEDGVEAAAGSALVGKYGIPQGHADIRADRPFLVALTAAGNDAPLFLAVIRDPR